MPDIESVEIDGVRGISGKYELSKRTLLIGPNGSGKSTIPVTIDFTLLGLVPGYQKKETFANASGETMRGVVKIADHIIERTLTQGKTLRERIKIDNGTPTDAKAAAPMLELILGKEPPVLNMPAFWDATSTEKRRILLRLVADPETQATLAADEEKARDAKKELTRQRQVAEKTVENLSKRLAGMEKPAGNLEHMRKEIKELSAQIRETETKVAEGQANDKARANLTSQIEKVADLSEKELPELDAKLEELDAELTQVREQLDALVEPPHPVERVALTGRAAEVVGEVVQDLTRLACTLEDTAAEDESASTLCDSFKDMATRLGDLLPSDEAVAEAQAMETAYNAYQQEHLRLVASQEVFTDRIRLVKAQIEAGHQRVKTALEAQEDLDKLGDGADQKDVAALNGMCVRRQELEAKVEPLAEVAMVQREIEAARLEAEQALSEEDQAKKKLQEAIDAQQAVVEQAAEELAKRSKSILPYGNLRLEDDGKDITIFWAKSKDLRVQRTTLSGGEQALFDCALGHALAPGALIVIEGAEIDNANIVRVMDHIRDCEFQVLLLTCHAPDVVPENWTVLNMGK